MITQHQANLVSFSPAHGKGSFEEIYSEEEQKQAWKDSFVEIIMHFRIRCSVAWIEDTFSSQITINEGLLS